MNNNNERSDFALLLEEMCGRKYLTDCKLSDLTHYNPVIISKGTILEAATHTECRNIPKESDFIFNYKVMGDSNIKLQCNPVEVRQLTNRQMRLLQAVEHLQDRIEVVHKLEWAEGLRPGVGIHVTIPSYPYPVKGIIQHCGKVPDKYGIHFRVELIGSEGNKDCEKFKHKIAIVSIDKITESSSASAACVRKSSDTQPDLSQKCGLRSGDRVMVQRKDGEWIQGTVKFVGSHEKNPEPGPLIGIELDQNTHPSLIPGNINGLDRLFMATRYDATKLFVPISAVKKGEVSVAPDHHYNTRLAAQKRQQQLSGHAQPSQEIEYNKHMAQLQDSNRTDMQHGERITRSGPNVDRSQKPNKQLLLSDRGHPVPGHVKRVVQHDYEPMPGPAKEPQSNPNMETMSKPIKLSLDQPKLDNIPDHSPAIMDENPYNLEKGSMIEFSNPTQYGVIKWIGYLTDISKCKVAGVEMEKLFPGSHDGMWQGVCYFESQKGKGLFLPLFRLKPDQRFGGTFKKEEKRNQNVEVLVIKDRYVSAKLDTGTHIGRKKGIQGQHNSCYIDATLFGMFAFSDVFDDLFLDKCVANTEFERKKDEVRNIIQQKIVYPLREEGFVVYEAVMELRTTLDSLQAMKGITSDEKDPEEFLNLLLKKVFVASAYLEIRRPSGEDKEFFVQLFIDPPKDGVVTSNTQSLLQQMFLEQNITFTKYPLKLFLQIPRYGKKFKSYNRVIPSIKLDVSILCETSQPCFICNNPGNVVCNDCGSTNIFKPNIKYLCFCQNCSNLWHGKPTRVHHKPYPRKVTDDFETGRLELLSVICIETSHYVCFTRITGSGTDRWVFFDSMAERTDDEYNLPKVADCTELLKNHVYGYDSIGSEESKKLPELVRRFVEDAYLCIYIDREGTMYQ